MVDYSMLQELPQDKTTQFNQITNPLGNRAITGNQNIPQNQFQPQTQTQIPSYTCIPGTPGCPAVANQNQTGVQQNQTPSRQYRQQYYTTSDTPQYLNQFLSTQLGRKVKIDFLIGTNSFVDKTGILLEVGANYILINETSTDDIIACDFYNIKFVTIYY